MASKYSFSLLNADCVQLNESWNYKNVISPFYRLYFITEGLGKLSTPDEEILLEEGHLYLIPSYTLFNQSCDGALGQYYIHFAEESADGDSLFAFNRKLFKTPAPHSDIAGLKKIVELNPGRDLRKSDNPKVYEKTSVIRSFLDRNKQLTAAALFETEGIIMQLLARFIATGEFAEPVKNSISPKIPAAVNYICTHLQEQLTVNTLAAQAHLSADYFSKLFQEETGERPLAFIQRKRIERAQFLLVTSALPLAVVAKETGFEDLSYFSRTFKSLTGHTPGEYKRMNAIFTAV
jgi:AraC family transcriptional regulator